MSEATVHHLDDIREAFQLFDGWEDRYRFVIDLGKELPELAGAERIDDNLVRGCQSQVWLIADYDANAGVMRLKLDSDAHIVRGLIAIVLAAYDGRSPRHIVDFDIEGLFDELDLLQHLSATRGNGLRAMVARIREAAAAELDQASR
ncbi:MAG: SufE family protein [Pseudomonadales bacterium]